MAGREHKAVTVDPARTFRVVHQGVAIKHRANISGSQRESEVTGRTGVDRIDGEPARLIGCLGEEMSLQGHGEKPLRNKRVTHPRESPKFNSPTVTVKFEQKRGRALRLASN
jgi:hypothetical protein